jgi:hypothetical protein
MHCIACGRFLLRAAATVTTADGTGYSGPACARKLGLLAPRVARPRTVSRPARRGVESRQMELVA